MKTSELTGVALDWAVAKCEGATDEWHTDKPFFWDGVPCVREAGHDVQYSPSTNWALGGPIIEREWGSLVNRLYMEHGDGWAGYMHKGGCTTLVAFMRCYVASKLGDEVELPEALNYKEGETA